MSPFSSETMAGCPAVFMVHVLLSVLRLVVAVQYLPLRTPPRTVCLICLCVNNQYLYTYIIILYTNCYETARSVPSKSIRSPESCDFERHTRLFPLRGVGKCQDRDNREEKHVDRQIDRQVDRKKYAKTDRLADRLTDRNIQADRQRHAERQTDRNMQEDRQTDRQNRQKYKQGETDMQTERQIETCRQTDRLTGRQAARPRWWSLFLVIASSLFISI